MARVKHLLAVTLVVLACLVAPAYAEAPAATRQAAPSSFDVPVLAQPVNDLANVIDPASAAAMDQMIRSLQASTGDSVIVASVKTFAPYGTIDEYAVKLYERAGIGAKGKDNGVLILVAVDDRRARIEVGYGLEGFLTDGFSGDVIRSAMLPAFRRGAYGEGLLDATTQVVSRIARERNVTVTNLPAPRPERRVSGQFGGAAIVKLIFFVLVLLFIMGRNSSKGGRGGGGGSGLLGIVLGQMLANSGRRGGGWSGGDLAAVVLAAAGLVVSAADALAAAARPAAGRGMDSMVILNMRSTVMKLMTRFGAAVAVVVISAALSGCSYNKFTAQEQSIKSSWSEVENQLQRRHDLIPNLVETTKGFAEQEKAVFNSIAEARSKMAGAQTPADKMAAGNAESSAIGRLLVVVENYPVLKSDQVFMRLMDDLSGTENRLAVSRMRYNEQVQAYNTLRKSFPANMTGKVFGFQAEYPYFAAPDDAKTAPKVNFGK